MAAGSLITSRRNGLKAMFQQSTKGLSKMPAQPEEDAIMSINKIKLNDSTDHSGHCSAPWHHADKDIIS